MGWLAIRQGMSENAQKICDFMHLAPCPRDARPSIRGPPKAHGDVKAAVTECAARFATGWPCQIPMHSNHEARAMRSVCSQPRTRMLSGGV